MTNPRTEKRRRWRRRLAERATMADTSMKMFEALHSVANQLASRLEQAEASAKHWQDRYNCLAGLIHVTAEDQAARATMLQMEAVPATAEALSHKFVGLTLYQWATMPDELTSFFAMTEAASMWRRQLSEAGRTFTLYKAGKPTAIYMAGNREIH